MADKRDIKKELAAAVATGNVAELAALAYQLLGKVEADDERRARQAEKKRTSRDVARQVETSRTADLSIDVSGRPGTSGDVSAVVPPLRSLTTPPTQPSVEFSRVLAELANPALDVLVQQMCAWYSDTQWEDVAAFFLRRRADRWYDWAKAMTRDCGGSSQFTGDDLLRVCQDDGTLDKRIGSAGVLRKFLAPARAERVGTSERSPPPGKPGERRDLKPTLNVANRTDTKYPEASDPDKPILFAS